jgi:hypothetical protein
VASGSGTRHEPLVDLVRTRSGTAAALVGAAVAALALAGRGLQERRFGALEASLLAVGTGLAAAAAIVGESRERCRTRPGERRHAPRPVLVAAGVALAAGAWLTSSNGVYTRVNVGLWLAALAAWLVAWWPTRPRNPGRRRPRRPPSAQVATVVVFLAVIAIAVFFRFHALGSVPGEPTSDHAEKLLDVRDVLRGQHPIYFARNGGREPAQFYVSAAAIQWLGFDFSWQTLKLGTAAVGAIAVAAVFLVGRELAGAAAGLFAAALAAVSRWPVGDDRLGLRMPYGILASALTFWLLLRYLRRGDRRDALLAGGMLGLGLHGYATFRVVLVAAGVFFVAAAVERRRERGWRRALLDGALAYATAFVAAIPFVHYAVRFPDVMFTRMTDRVNGPQGFASTASLFLDNTRNALLAFNWRGDAGWVVGVPGRPFLDALSGGLLLGGLAVLAVLAARRSTAALALLVSGPILLLSSTLNFAYPIENPSANRLSVAVPLTFAVAALPAALLWRAVTAAPGSRGVHAAWRVCVAAAMLAAFVVVAHSNYASYFRDYRDAYAASADNTIEVARAIERQNVPRQRVFLVDYPYWLDGRLLALELGDIDWATTNAIAPGAEIPDAPVGRSLFAVFDADRANRLMLRRRYPRGRYIAVRSAVAGQDFGLFLLPEGGGKSP